MDQCGPRPGRSWQVIVWLGSFQGDGKLSEGFSRERHRRVHLDRWLCQWGGKCMVAETLAWDKAEDKCQQLGE
jgi:hypothetical protein